jgi:hypothetical protein
MFVQSPDYKIGLRSFMNLQPDNVRRMREKDRITCSCERHENLRLGLQHFELMTETVHKDCPCPDDAPCNLRGKVPTSCHGFVDWAVCAPDEADGEHAPPCVEGTCVVCAAGLGNLTFCEKEKDLSGNLKVRRCREGWQEQVLWCTPMVHCTVVLYIMVPITHYTIVH